MTLDKIQYKYYIYKQDRPGQIYIKYYNSNSSSKRYTSGDNPRWNLSSVAREMSYQAEISATGDYIPLYIFIFL